MINSLIRNNWDADYSLNRSAEEDEDTLIIRNSDVTDPHGFFPVVKLLERKTWNPELFVPVNGIVVKIMDMVNKSGKTMRPCYESIKMSGGIHGYLQYDGSIILSSIMPDLMIRNLDLDRYSEIITTCNPDYCFTPDSETYRGEIQLSAREIERTLDDTKELIRKHPDVKFVALPKGANVWQIEGHAQALHDLGLNTGVLHAGELIREDRRLQRHNARVALEYATTIHKQISNLLIYGAGTRKMFRMFERFNGVIVQNHISNSLYGSGVRIPNLKIKNTNGVDKETIMTNLKMISQHYEFVHNGLSWQSTLVEDYCTHEYNTNMYDEMVVA